MARTFLEDLNKELAKAKEERPLLEKDQAASNKMLDESINKDGPDSLFYHVSHNSHGDWSKHWAHGGFEDDDAVAAEQLIPGATQNKL